MVCFSVVVLLREEVRGEDGRGELHCPQMDEAGMQAKFTPQFKVLQFKYNTDYHIWVNS